MSENIKQAISGLRLRMLSDLNSCFTISDLDIHMS